MLESIVNFFKKLFRMDSNSSNLCPKPYLYLDNDQKVICLQTARPTIFLFHEEAIAFNKVIAGISGKTPIYLTINTLDDCIERNIMTGHSEDLLEFLLEGIRLAKESSNPPKMLFLDGLTFYPIRD